MAGGNPVREAVEVAVVCLITLVLVGAVLGIGTWGWSASCYAGHQGEPVRWSFPGGCEVNLGGTWVTVGTTHAPATS